MPRKKKPPTPQFPPKLKLTGEDAEGRWKVFITGVQYVSSDPSDDPAQYPYEDIPSVTPIIAEQE